MKCRVELNVEKFYLLKVTIRVVHVIDGFLWIGKSIGGCPTPCDSGKII